MRSLFATVLFITIISGCAQSAMSQSVTTAVDKTMIPIETLIEQKMNEGGIVGIGAAIIVDKKLVWAKGFGYADKENKKPFTVDTVMNIGSIAKNFTGVCLMRAVEEGKLSLDENINKYLPFKVVNPYFPDEKITLRPGIKAEMLADLNKEVGVILFTNTGLSEKDLIKYHFGIFDELFRYGVKLKEEKTKPLNDPNAAGPRR